jgi:hypothetical protein
LSEFHGSPVRLPQPWVRFNPAERTTGGNFLFDNNSSFQTPSLKRVLGEKASCLRLPVRRFFSIARGDDFLRFV